MRGVSGRTAADIPDGITASNYLPPTGRVLNSANIDHSITNGASAAQPRAALSFPLRI
jgi:hypothetical protein